MAPTDRRRWLEGEGAEVQRWVSRHDDAARAHLRALPRRRELAAAVARHVAAWGGGLPQRAGDGWTWVAGAGGPGARDVRWSSTLDGERRLVCTAAGLLEHPLAEVEWCVASPDGTKLAVALGAGGDMRSAISVVDTATGEPIAAPDLALNGGRAAWRPDSSGLVCWRAQPPLVPGESVAPLVELSLDGTVSVLGEPPAGGPEAYVPQLSPDGSTLLLSGPPAHACLTWALDLASGRWRRLAPADGASAGLREVHVGSWAGGAGYCAIAFDELDGGELVAGDPLADDPGWRRVFADESLVLRAVAPLGDGRLVVYAFEQGEARILVVDPAAGVAERAPLGAGAAVRADADLHQALGQLPLVLDRGRLAAIVAADGTGPALVSWAPGERATTPLAPALVDWRVDHERASCLAPDGHAVRYDSLTAPGADGSAPTLIYAYGGFGISLACGPHPGMLAPWVEAGGRLVVAHLRGDGDYGRAAWHAGRRAGKQRTFDDLFAVGDDLCRRGLADPSTLALAGVSNGSLLVSAAAAQRPELFRAVAAIVPLFDLDNFTGDRRGAWLAAEYGDPGDPTEDEWLRAWAPDGRLGGRSPLPATIVVAGESDIRIAPWHGWKLAAALEAAGGPGATVLLRSRPDRGHQSASLKAPADETAEWLGFLMEQVGLVPAAD